MKTSQAVDSAGFLRHKDGHEVPVRIRAVPVYNQHRSIIGALSTFEELQAGISRERGEANASSPDFEDHVTGVASRAMMQAHLQAKLATLSPGNCSHWVFLAKVQGLADSRASLGAEAASSLLRLMVRTVKSCLWTSDLVGRWSDDQYFSCEWKPRRRNRGSPGPNSVDACSRRNRVVGRADDRYRC